MPTLKQRSDGGWFAIANEGAIVTYQLEPEAVRDLRRLGVGDGDHFSKASLNLLKRRGLAYTGGSGSDATDPLPSDFIPIGGFAGADPAQLASKPLEVRHLTRPDWGRGRVESVRRDGRAMRVCFGDAGGGARLFPYPSPEHLEFVARIDDHPLSDDRILADAPCRHRLFPHWGRARLDKASNDGSVAVAFNERGCVSFLGVGAELEVRCESGVWVPWNDELANQFVSSEDLQRLQPGQGDLAEPASLRGSIYVRSRRKPEWGVGRLIAGDPDSDEVTVDFPRGGIRRPRAPYIQKLLQFVSWSDLQPSERRDWIARVEAQEGSAG